MKKRKTEYKPRRVAMLGTAESHTQAPLEDPNWEIWGTGGPSPYITRADRWFDVHRLDGYPPEWQAGWRKTMAEFTPVIRELWMFYPKNLGPKTVEYPFQRIMNRFGTFFQTSSFSWMLALAIDEMRPLDESGLVRPVRNGDEIGIWGVDMEYGGEYYEQRQGLHHFFRVAAEAGIKVTMLTTSGVAYKPIPYPFWDDDPLLNKNRDRKKRCESDKARMTKLVESVEKSILRLDGAAVELRTLLEAPKTDLKKRLAMHEKNMAALNLALVEPKSQLLRVGGMIEQIDWLENYIKP